MAKSPAAPKKPPSSRTPKRQISDDLRRELESAIDNIVERPKRAQVIERVEAVISRVEFFSGPLPPAGEFASYEDVLPGAADRILTMAEDALQTQRVVTEVRVRSDADDRKRAMIFGFSALVLLIVCAFAGGLLQGWQIASVFLATGAIGAIAQIINAARGGK